MYRIDDGSMKFLPCHQRNVHEILALCVSPNKKVIAVCEKIITSEEADLGNAQVRSICGGGGGGGSSQARPNPLQNNRPTNQNSITGKSIRTFFQLQDRETALNCYTMRVIKKNSFILFCFLGHA